MVPGDQQVGPVEAMRTLSLQERYSLRISSYFASLSIQKYTQTFRVLSRKVRRHLAPVTTFASLTLCRGEDSNLQGLLRVVLSHVRLPISPPRHYSSNFTLLCAPSRDRTYDLILKRDLLYQLSYGRKRGNNERMFLHSDIGSECRADTNVWAQTRKQ